MRGTQAIGKKNIASINSNIVERDTYNRLSLVTWVWLIVRCSLLQLINRHDSSVGYKVGYLNWVYDPNYVQ